MLWRTERVGLTRLPQGSVIADLSFAGDAVDYRAMHSAGVLGVVEYASFDQTKDVNAGRVAKCVAAGMPMAVVWETTQTRCRDGGVGGATSDAKHCVEVLDGISYPHDMWVAVAVDYNEPASDEVAVTAYLAAFWVVLHDNGFTGGLGVYGPPNAWKLNGPDAGTVPVAVRWQAAALDWAGGVVAGDADVLQYVVGPVPTAGFGGSVDENRVVSKAGVVMWDVANDAAAGKPRTKGTDMEYIRVAPDDWPVWVTDGIHVKWATASELPTPYVTRIVADEAAIYRHVLVGVLPPRDDHNPHDWDPIKFIAGPTANGVAQVAGDVAGLKAKLDAAETTITGIAASMGAVAGALGALQQDLAAWKTAVAGAGPTSVVLKIAGTLG